MSIKRSNNKVLVPESGFLNTKISSSQAFKNTGIWRSISTSEQSYSSIKTGFSELDNILALGGWPMETTAEIALAQLGIGELRLLFPALRKCIEVTNKRHIVWIAPPHLPYAPALIKQHIVPSDVVIVRPKGIAHILWAAEQALLSKSCAAVFTWTGAYLLSQKESRRLQLAVEKSDAWHVQFRHANCLQRSSAARLRLELSSRPDGKLMITVRKQPQGATDLQCVVSLKPRYENWRMISVEQLSNNTGFTKATRKGGLARLGLRLLKDECADG